MEGFGKAKFGKNARNWFKLKDGDSVYRILPPMGDLREDGKWSVFYSIHYGYKNTAGEMRTFVSPEQKNRKTKMVEVRDAAKERIQQLEAKLKAAKEAGASDLVEQLLKLVGGKKSRYNLDNNHYMNVVDLQGNIGILKIRHRAKLALDAQIEKLRKNGIEPLDPLSGRYFVFTRSGMGMETTYQVSIYKKKINVPNVGEVEQDVVHTIDEEFARRCFTFNRDTKVYTYKEAALLTKLFKTPTSEEVDRIVKEGESAIDEIFDSKNAPAAATTTAAPTQVYETEDYSGIEDDETPTPVKATPEPAQQPTVVQNQTPITSTVVAETFAAPKPAPAAPKTTAEAVSTQSDEEFLKSLGL